MDRKRSHPQPITHGLKDREWIMIFLFIALIATLVASAYISRAHTDKMIRTLSESEGPPSSHRSRPKEGN